MSRDHLSRSHQASSSRSGLFNTILSTLRRGGGHHQEPSPEPEDLGLKTLRQVYKSCSSIVDQTEQYHQIYNILPLFCTNCQQYKGQALVTKFPEVYEFASDVSQVFVSHVKQSALGQNIASRALSTLKYFEPGLDADSHGPGHMVLRVLLILAEGPESVVDMVMNENVCNTLIQCLSLFLELPATGTHSQGSASGNSSPSTYSSSPRGTPTYFTSGHSPTVSLLQHATGSRTTPTHTTRGGQAPGGAESPVQTTPTQSVSDGEAQTRLEIEQFFRRVLNKILRSSTAVRSLLKDGRLTELFGIISLPCPFYNKMWRKCAAHTLITICRYSLSDDVIGYIHGNRCINLYLGNIRNAIRQQPPLELVEMIATLFCCLKDSSDFSQVLLEDFSNSQGYKLLYSYLLFLEECPFPDAGDALRNLVLLIQNLIMDGFHSLEIPSGMNFAGPFQDPRFTLPSPTNQGSTVRNMDAFLTLSEAFQRARSKKLCLVILETFLNVFKSDAANYFIVACHHPLPTMLEKMTEKDKEVQASLLKLVDHVILELNYVPTAEMTGVGLLLEKKELPGTVSLVLNFLLRLISYQSRFKNVFREVGIFTMLINVLRGYASDLEEKYRTEREDVASPTSRQQVVSSPSLPLEDIQGESEECMFLLMECIRATIDGVEQNGEVFRENKGTSCTLALIRYSTPRRMALKVMRQLILLEGGMEDFNSLLNQLIQFPQTFVNVKSEILHTVLGVFQLESAKKAVFREVSGFHYLISLLASLIGSLTPKRACPWDKVSPGDILQLVQLIFITITAAMQDDSANRHFFENDIRYDSFTAPLLLLGCFSRNSTHIEEATPITTQPNSAHGSLQTSGCFSNFEAEFKTWQAPEKSVDEDSFVFYAAEIFRYLRDLSVDVTNTFSPSLLESTTSVSSKTLRNRDKVFYGAPPITSKSKGGVSFGGVGGVGGGMGGTPNLIHPGAILCMIDLLPSVKYPEESDVGLLDVTGADDVFETSGSDEMGRGQSRGSSPFSTSSPKGQPADDAASSSKDHTHIENLNLPSSARSKSASPESDSFYDARLEEEECPRSPGKAGLDADNGRDPNVVELSVVKEVDILVEGVGGASMVQSQADVEEGEESEEMKMRKELARKWCVFLQERVVSEIYTLSVTERNQQALCQVGLPQRILSRCPGVLADETHPLHHALERTFEKLSYQALTSSDFRSFLRLGNPLSCSLSSITPDDLRSGRYSAFLEAPPSSSSSSSSDVSTNKDQVTNQDAPFGGSLSLARIQSLVTMTTSRDGCQSLVAGAPPFIEFDLSLDGFGCLFLPSVFPLLEASNLQTTPATTAGGVGGGDRIFPPTGGLTFTTWVLVNRFSVDEPGPNLSLLSLSHTVSSKNQKLNHIPCLLIHLKPSQNTLLVSTHFPPDLLLEDVAGHGDEWAWQHSNVTFRCPEVFQSQSWNHVAVAMVKPGLKGKAKVTLFVNGKVMGTQKMPPIHAVHASPLSAHFGDSASILINAHIGTHVTQRHVSLLTYRLGPTFLFEEHLSPTVVASMFKLGPSYFGSFQSPVHHDPALVVHMPSNSMPLPLVSEEKVLFGVIATHPLVKTVKELGKMYNHLDVSTIRKELSLSEADDITPVTLVHNTAVHLPGSSRTLGAAICGYSGVRFFHPQPLRTLLSSVGGTKVMLGLVAMATTVDSLYASMKALVCIVGNNQVALREMERTGGFKVLGMLLRSKSHLVNSNILHLTYTLVGTVDSEQESSTIPNLIAFKDLLADFAVWSRTSEDIQCSLFNHLFELLSHMSHKLANAEHMLKMKMASFLLYRLLDSTLTVFTIKKICNVISALLGIIPQSEDLIRLGQLLATTLPSNRTLSENTIYLYHDDEASPTASAMGVTSPSQQKQFGRFRGDEQKQRRAIVLRNVLFDVLISLLTRNMELNSQFARELYHSLGFDWLFLFMNATVHTETVVRAVRVLVQMLCDHTLRQNFINGDIFGSWVRDYEYISEELSSLLKGAMSQHNPFHKSQCQQVPGPLVLAYLLPCHSDLSQVYLLLSATLLGRQCTDISYSAQFDLETLEDVFHTGVASVVADYKISSDMAGVLLVIARALLHKENADDLQQNAVNLVKFFERLYKRLPQFAALAATPEFIDALVATLFPPVAPLTNPSSVSDVADQPTEVTKADSNTGTPSEGEDWIMIENDVLPGTDGREDGNTILYQQDSLAVRTIIKLLRTIAIDGFSTSSPLTKDSPASSPTLERVLNSTPPGISPVLIKRYQTLILQSMMEFLETGGKDDIMVIFREGMLAGNMERSFAGLGVFSCRLVDKVLHRSFLGSSLSVYKFLVWLVEQARRVPKIAPLSDIHRSLNRLILFEVSHIPSSEMEQKSFMDLLCLFSSQAHVIFDETNIDDQFLECLLFCLLRIVMYEKFLGRNPLLVKMNSFDGKDGGGGGGGGKGMSSMASASAAAFVDFSSLQDQLPSGYVPGSLAMMKGGANRLWTKMLEFKREELQRLLAVDLPAPSESHRDTLMGSLGAHAAMAGVVYANKTFLRLQNCHLFLNDSLKKTWNDFVAEEKSLQAMESAQKDSTSTVGGGGVATIRKGLVASMALRVRRKKGTTVNKEDLVNEFVNVYSHLVVLASQKYFEVLLRKHQRNVEYRLRFAGSEWSKIEHELTRERGLWGPEKSSPLDKWMIDPVEGPCRMRKRLCRNHDFYVHYPFTPLSEQPTNKKHKRPSSLDSELQALRERLFQRPTILATPSHLTTAPTMPSVRGKEDSAATATEGSEVKLQDSVPVSTLSTPAKVDIFNHPDSDDPVAQTLFKMIEPEDKINHRYQCARLTGLDSKDGVLLLGHTHFYVIEGITITKDDNIVDIESASEDLYDPVVPGSKRSDRISRETAAIPITCIKMRYDTIREVHKRRYLLRHCAVEVFAVDGRSHFLIFHTKFRDKAYQKLLSQSSRSAVPQADSQYIAGMNPESDPEHSHGIFSVLTGTRKLVDKWVNGEMTNFQYLMHLNTLAGRSYNDLMQYPVFPWILADYTSQTLDLSDPKTFRDLSKPMGALSEDRLKRFIERFKYFEDPTGEGTPPYYYGTHYSSAMIVASYLIRMEPFTQHFLKLQGGHFDLPDRLFHSIPDAWRSASENNMADIKELIPEFYYLPEFLTNSNNFDLGTKQSGVTLGNIVLPPWSKGDPNEFIRIHREALECDYVSQNLHKWIDLIFGYKQRGEEALAAHNVFHHLFYEGAVDIDKIEEPMKKMAVISFIHNFGQVPKQLFKRPHRQRKVWSTTLPQDVPSSAQSSALSSSAQPTGVVEADKVFYKNLVQLMPSREPLRVIAGEVSQMVCLSDGKAPLAVDRHKLLLPWANYKYYLMWGFPDHSAKVATVDTDKVVAVFEGLHEGRILCAAVANDNTLLTGGESTVVYVWEVNHGGREKSPVQLHLKHTLHGHNGQVICLATSSSYNLIASGSKDGTCILWDMTNFSFIRQLSGHSIPVNIVSINSLNGYIVTCTKNQIRLWTVNGHLLAETPGVITSSVKLLCCVMSELFEWNKDNVIVTGSSDGIVRMWRLEHVSDEELQLNAKARRGSAADSMFSTESIGDSMQDILMARDNYSASVVNRLRSATLEDQDSSPTHKDSPIQQSQEQFRPTGQSSKPVSSDTLASETMLAVSMTTDNITGSPRPGRSTFSEDEEEERTAGSGVDVIASLLGDSGDHSELCSSLPRSSSVVGVARTASGQKLDAKDSTSGFDHKAEPLVAVKDRSGSNGAEEGKTDGSDDKKEEEGSREKGWGLQEDKELEELLRVNPSYAKYVIERRRQAEELRQRTGKWERRLKLVHTLTMHTSVHRRDNDRPAAVTSLCISKDHKRLYVGDSRGRIFSWTVSDNLGVMQHWIIDSAVNSCSRCKVEFTFTERKHHCRDCGNIFCAKCSGNEIEVERLKIHRKVRVCNRCYDKITAERTKNIFKAQFDI